MANGVSKNRILCKTFLRVFFEISTKRWIFYTTFNLLKKFSSRRRVILYFFMNYKVQDASNHSIYRKTVLINRSQIFINFPKLYARHPGVKITDPYCTYNLHKKFVKRFMGKVLLLNPELSLCLSQLKLNFLLQRQQKISREKDKILKNLTF